MVWRVGGMGYSYSTDTIFFNIWQYYDVALVSSVKASPFWWGYCRVELKINMTLWLNVAGALILSCNKNTIICKYVLLF